MKPFVTLPSVNNVAAGQKFILNCPKGPTYDRIQFKLTNIDPSAGEITSLKVKVGSKTLLDLADAATLVNLNSYYQRDENAGYLTLWFYRPEMDTEEERSLFCLGTQDVPSLTIEGVLGAGVVSPAIEARAVTRGPAPMGVVSKIVEFPVSFATSGVQHVDSIPRTPGGALMAVHLGKADISNLEMKVNYGAGQQTIIDAAKADLHALAEQYKRTPVTASYTHVDFALSGKIADPLRTGPLADMRFIPTLDTSGAVNIVAEYAEGYDGI